MTWSPSHPLQLLAALVVSLSATSCGAPRSGTFEVLTYNVAGLPQGISSSEPERNIPQISGHLSAYDIVLVQEDFYYHADLMADADFAYQSDPYRDPPRLFDLGDGLNRASHFRFADHQRVVWGDCNGTTDCASDCLAAKGFTFARHRLAEGAFVDVYNLHNEAGRCPRDYEIRAASMTMLADEILTRSAGEAVIVGGDFNLHVDRAEDAAVLNELMARTGLVDSCVHVSCGSTTIDRVLFRSGDGVTLDAAGWRQPTEFVDEDTGDPLSDHTPTAVQFTWGRP